MGLIDVQCVLLVAKEEDMDVIVGRECRDEWQYDEVDVETFMGELYSKEDKFCNAYEDLGRVMCIFSDERMSLEVW